MSSFDFVQFFPVYGGSLLTIDGSLDWQVPEEEKELGPQDRLIHVYHFTRDASQNHMVNCSKTFGFCVRVAFSEDCGLKSAAYVVSLFVHISENNSCFCI